jgi:hypothetical protein
MQAAGSCVHCKPHSTISGCVIGEYLYVLKFRMEENVDGGARDKGNDVRIIGLDLYEILNNS